MAYILNFLRNNLLYKNIPLFLERYILKLLFVGLLPAKYFFVLGLSLTLLTKAPFL